MPAPHPILATAFGPFGGRAVNASSMALAALRKSHPALRTRTLPVDLLEAPRRFRDALRRVNPSAILLLGEAGEAEHLRLERRAWNSIDFPIPDVAGRQPRGRRIDQGPNFLETKVDVEGLARTLDQHGHHAEVSTDPGRYLCNRIYHDGLQRTAVPALFVHLPLEARLPTAEAVAALSRILCFLDSSAAVLDSPTLLPS